MPTPQTSNPNIIATRQRHYTDAELSLFCDTAEQRGWTWCAVAIPSRFGGSIRLPLNGAPFFAIKKSDLATDYFLNWNAVKSQWNATKIKPISRYLPVEGYDVEIVGIDPNRINRNLAEANRLRSRFGRLRFTFSLSPQLNLQRFFYRNLGLEFGFNNIGKVRIVDGKIVILLTCAVTPQLGFLIHLINERAKAMVSFLSRNCGIKEYPITVIAIHRFNNRL